MHSIHSNTWIGRVARLSMVALIALAGCEADKPTTLTQKDLERIAITQQKIDLVEAAGGMALVIGGETITSDEIIRWPVEYGETSVSALTQLKPLAQTANLDEFKTRARQELEDILMTRITDVLIYQLAKDKRGDEIDEALDKAADSELRQFIMLRGGDDAKADADLREMGIDRKRFKELRKRALLVSDYVGAQLPLEQPVTYRQMIAKYDELKDEYFSVDSQLEFSLIDIQPTKLKVEDPNVDRLVEAKKLADRLVRRINAGEDFAELAKEYSNGPMAVFGGKRKPLSPDSLVSEYRVLVEAADGAESGEVVGPIETLGHIFIMKLHKKLIGGYKPFVEVQDVVKKAVLIERQNKVTQTIYDQLSTQAKKGLRDDFINFCLEKIHELANRPEEKLDVQIAPTAP